MQRRHSCTVVLGVVAVLWAGCTVHSDSGRGGSRPAPPRETARSDGRRMASTTRAAGPDGDAAPGPKPAGAVCRRHAECLSGVCERVKADMGRCAPETCRPGQRADHNRFYCTSRGKWAAARRPGESCAHAYECWQPDCFMDPSCGLRPRRTATCQQGKCVLVTAPPSGVCARPGYRRVLAPEEYMRDDKGRCVESLAQRRLRTVCVPCGNGRCDRNESACNCPEDCGTGSTSRPGLR